MVRQFLKDIAPTEGDKAATSAEDLLDNRRWDEAELLFRQLLEEEPANIEAQLGLARSLIGQGEGCKAKFYLDNLVQDAASMVQAEPLLPLAEYMCAAEKSNDNAEVTPIEAQYRQAARLLRDGKYAPALDGLLDVLRYNKNYRDGQAKAVRIGVFELLGNEDPLTNAYRREMASVLF